MKKAIASPALDRAPPQDCDAEAAVLGSAILDNDTIPAILKIVRAKDFYRESHGLIFGAVESLYEDGKNADLLTVREELRRKEQLDQVGGVDAITAILDRTPTAANAEQYAKIVAEHAARRRMIAFGDIIVRQGYEATKPAEEFIKEAQEALARFAKDSLAPPPLRRFRTGTEILKEVGDEGPPWLCEWLVAKGLVTLFSAKAKAGKSTMLAAVLGCILRGEPFCDLPVERAGVVYVSEEDASTLKEKIRRFGTEDAYYLTRSELFPKPTFSDLLRQVATVAHQRKAGVIVLDTFAALAGLGRDMEKDAGVMQEIADAVIAVAKEGFAVIIVHHLKKGDESEEGEGARGSGALLAAVDIVLELRRVKDSMATPARELKVLCRYENCPPDPLVIELGAHAYKLIGDPAAMHLKVLKERVLHLLSDFGGGPVRRGDLADGVKGNAQGLGLALEALTLEGMVTRSGRGKPGDPYAFTMTDAARESAGAEPTRAALPAPSQGNGRKVRELFPRATAPAEDPPGPVHEAEPVAQPDQEPELDGTGETMAEQEPEPLPDLPPTPEGSPDELPAGELDWLREDAGEPPA